MKAILAIGLGIAVFVALGAVVPWTSTAGLVLPLLGKWGAFSYKGLAGFFTCGAVYGR
jgi:hypothetical protein